MSVARFIILGSLFLLPGAAPGLAAPAPVPPCAGAPVPSWPEPDAAPAVSIWHPGEADGWHAPACSGLKVGREAVLVAVAGSFREPGGIDAVLERIGAVSRQRAILAWDARRQAWRPMLEDAAALAGPDADLRRADLAPADFRPGARLHVLYDDADPLGPVVYETLVQARSGDGVDLVTRNVVPGRLMGFTVAAAGDIASHVAVRREAGDLIRYYALTTVTLAPMAAAMTPDAAHVNRAVATFRYVAGIPTDSEPPASAG